MMLSETSNVKYQLKRLHPKFDQRLNHILAEYALLHHVASPLLSSGFARASSIYLVLFLRSLFAVRKVKGTKETSQLTISEFVTELARLLVIVILNM